MRSRDVATMGLLLVAVAAEVGLHSATMIQTPP
jgi:hypothetical protein